MNMMSEQWTFPNRKRRKDHPQNTEKVLGELNTFAAKLQGISKYFIGYPVNHSYNLDEFFSWWQKSPLVRRCYNDVGDPWSQGMTITSRDFEQRVLCYFSKLFNMEASDTWGYLTSGGTRSNEQGLYLARERLQQYGEPVLYYSSAAHYTIANTGRLLNITRKIIPELNNGEINYAVFAKELGPSRPAIVSLTCGTTFKGAIDDIERISKIVSEKNIEHVHYHLDAALFGGYLPFIKDANAPQIDFSKHPYHSIAVSGHKFFGSPFPVGLFLLRKHCLDTIEPEYVEYIQSNITMLPCSRSSLNSLSFYWTLMTVDQEVFTEEADVMLLDAKYLFYQLQEMSYPSYINPYSNIVYFRKPCKEICDKWILASHHCPFYGDLSHVVVMQHVERALLDEFLIELRLDIKL